MKYKFFIRMDGVIYGPYSLQEYHDLDVPDDTEVMEEGVGEWYYASDFPSYEELNARENGYKLMPDGSIEKIKEKQSVNVEKKIPLERCGVIHRTVSQSQSQSPKNLSYSIGDDGALHKTHPNHHPQNQPTTKTNSSSSNNSFESWWENIGGCFVWFIFALLGYCFLNVILGK